MMLIERASTAIAFECEKPKLTGRLFLRPVEHERPDALPEETHAHIQLGHGFGVRRDEADQAAAEHRYAHGVMRPHLGREIILLLFEGMRVDDANAVFEARSPHANELWELFIA